MRVFGFIPEAFKAHPDVAVQCPEPGPPRTQHKGAPGTCTMHATTLDFGRVLGPALGLPRGTSLALPTPNHSHVIEARNEGAKWWKITSVLVTDPAAWLDADGTHGITSEDSLRAAQAAGQARPDVPPISSCSSARISSISRPHVMPRRSEMSGANDFLRGFLFRRKVLASAVGAALAIGGAALFVDQGSAQAQSAKARKGMPLAHFDQQILANVNQMIEQGRDTFRFDTFGDEAFWGDALKLHLAIEGTKFGGVGTGISPKAALGLGLKVDVDALRNDVVGALKRGEVNLDDPAVTLELLKANAVVGLTGFFNGDGSLKSIGIQCALCHSTVDNSFAFAFGIGHRLDGFANRDLDVGNIAAAAPELSSVATLLGTDQATVRKVLASWGPGKFDAGSRKRVKRGQ